MSVQAIAGALPFTPGGVGSQQALLVATLTGPSRSAVLASVGQQAAVTVWSVVIAIAAMVFVFRTRDWRGLLREGQEARSGVPEQSPSPPLSLLAHVAEPARSRHVADEAQPQGRGPLSNRGRDTALIQDAQVSDQRLEAAPVPDRADHRIGLQAHAVVERHSARRATRPLGRSRCSHP